MDSINSNQPEHNRSDLRGPDAIARIRDMIENSPNCFFCTSAPITETSGTHPMNVREVDDAGHLWFLSASDSYKNKELAADPAVRLYFQGSKHSDFLFLDGTAAVSADRKRIGELWEPILKTWFTEGIEDPRITVIHFTPSAGYYWDTKHGSAVAGLKMIIGATIGKTLDDSIEGTLKVGGKRG